MCTHALRPKSNASLLDSMRKQYTHMSECIAFEKTLGESLLDDRLLSARLRSDFGHTDSGLSAHTQSLTVFEVTAVRRVAPCRGREPSGRLAVRLAAVDALPGAEADPGAGARADVRRRVRQVLGFDGRDGEAHGRGHGFPRLLGVRQGGGSGVLRRRPLHTQLTARGGDDTGPCVAIAV